MKRIVWINKSNGQLCVTIPRNSGIKAGDAVTVAKDKIKKIVYTPVTGDIFHYGHLRLLQAANNLGDFHVCGVITDEAIASYKEPPIAGLKERIAIISSLQCVDMVMPQHDKDPTENLKKLHEQFNGAELILVYGSNWKATLGSRYVKEIGGRVVQPPYYSKLSTEKVIKKIFERHSKND